LGGREEMPNMQIGVLTGGGDVPGLNAAIRAVVRRADEQNHTVLGIKNGWQGLIHPDWKPLDLPSVSGILPVGGTMLGTSRTNPAKIERGYEAVLENLQKAKVDALIPIGGDDTLSVAFELHKRGFPVVGIPKTIDNDVYGTDFCIGFYSAVSIVADALDKLHSTASSHHRVMVLEVMGREAGWLALLGGLAGGADWIVIPEVPSSLQQIASHLKQRRSNGKDFSIIVVAEGASLSDVSAFESAEKDAFGHVRLDKRGIGDALARGIEKETGFETRVTVLGHIQRGGPPVVFDRLLATLLGVSAVDQVTAKHFGVMVALRGNAVVAVSLEEAIRHSPRKVTPELYELARLFY
jgi:phosphofructokinase-like protein